jgi:hypothetical protein
MKAKKIGVKKISMKGATAKKPHASASAKPSAKPPSMAAILKKIM